MKRFGLALAAMVSLASAWGAAAAREVPVADFFKDPEFSEITLSPDGKHIAVSVPQADRTVVAVMTTADRKIVQRFDYGENRHVRQAYWVNNERLLFVVGFKQGKFDFEVSKGDWYAANIDGKKRVDIPLGMTYNIVDLTPDDPKTILVSRSSGQTFLFKMDIYTGKTTTIVQSPVDGGTIVVDKAGRPRFSFGQMEDGSEIAFRRDGEKWTEIHRSPRGGATYRPVMVAEDGTNVYVAKGENGKAESVVLLDTASGKEKVLSSNGIVTPTDYVLSSDRKTVLGVLYEDGVPYWDFFAPEHPETKVFAGLVKAFPNHVVRFIDSTEDGRYIALRVYSDKDPGQAYLYDRQTGKAQFLAASMDWIKPAEMAPMKPVTVKTRDGLVLHGYLTTPAGSDGKNLPLIMHPHGGPHGPRDSWGFNPEVQFLANRGYAVLQMNFRGSGGYGNAFERAGYRKWGTAMQDDLTDSVQWAIREGIADRDRVCIYGASYGGYSALMSVVREPDLYRCTVGYVGVYDLDLQKDADYGQVKSGRLYMKDVHPETRAERMAHSAAFGVDRIKVPVMLVHGAKDLRVPIKHMHFLIEQMAKVGKKPEAVIVEEKEAHGFRDLQNQIDLYNQMQAFFDRHIGPKAGARADQAAAK